MKSSEESTDFCWLLLPLVPLCQLTSQLWVKSCCKMDDEWLIDSQTSLSENETLIAMPHTAAVISPTQV